MTKAMEKKNELQDFNSAWEGAKVCIVAYGSGRDRAPFKDQSFTMWSVNEVGTVIKDSRWDANFQIHYQRVIEDVYSDHLAYLKQAKFPTFTLEPIEGVNANPFPLLEVCAHFRSKYFNNTIAEMIAYAMFCKVKEIHLFGCHMDTDEEYIYQRPCLNYWIGRAEGMGIKVVLPEGCVLQENEFLYGLEQRPFDEGIINEGHIKRQVNEAVKEQAEAVGLMNYYQGQIDILNRTSKRIVTWKRDNRKEVTTGAYREGPNEEQLKADQFHKEYDKLVKGAG